MINRLDVSEDHSAVTVHIINLPNTKGNTLVIASYDENGVMLSTATRLLNAGEEGVIPIALDTTGATKIKIFIMNVVGVPQRRLKFVPG